MASLETEPEPQSEPPPEPVMLQQESSLGWPSEPAWDWSPAPPSLESYSQVHDEAAVWLLARMRTEMLIAMALLIMCSAGTLTAVVWRR